MIAPPPTLADLRYGTQLRAGLGVSTILADCDFETYSEAGYQWDAAKGRWGPLPHATKRGIQAVGAFRYAEHPTTEVLCFGYDLKDGLGRRQWRPGMPFPDDLRQHIADGKLLEAWNVQFEMAIWEAVCVPRLGWPVMLRSQWRCAMGKARAFALPGKLEEAAKVLGTTAQKMTDGKRLLNLFSVPRNPTKDSPALRRLPEHDIAGDGQRLYDYNLGDIETEAEISSRVPDLEGEELEWWHVDLDINARGVHLDMHSVEGCAAIVETALTKYNAELATLTGGAVESASQVQRLREWVASRGYSITSLDEEHVTLALKDPTLPPDCLRPLQIRELIGSASVKKLFSMRNQVCADGNLRGLFKYHAARTGRTTGADVQPTNLPSGGPSVRVCGACGQHYGKSKPACPWCYASAEISKVEGWSHRAADDALLVARSGSLAAFEMFFDDALPTISGCLRGLFVARPGHELICSDYSAIEAVALAELAGEEWRKEVFRGHGKIYEASASKTFGVPLDEILRHKKETGEHHPIRKKGKVLELALGYGGWVGALVAFGADEFMTEDEMATAASGWRVESPAIVEYWGGQSRYDRRVHVRYPELFGIEGAALNAVRNPGTEYSCRGIRFLVSQDVLYCTLLSGRRLTYHKPRLRPSDRRQGEETLSYEGWNTNPKNGPVGWIRIDTYGPKLVENCIAEGSLVLTDSGWQPIETVGLNQQVFDGVDFVNHGGLVAKSEQACIEVDGVWMTPDHLVLTDEGWKNAETPGLELSRPKIRNANRGVGGEVRREEAFLDLPLRVRGFDREARGAFENRHRGGQDFELRLQNAAVSGRAQDHSRDEQAPCLRGVAVDERQVPPPFPPSMGELRRQRNFGLFRLASFFREFLGRHGRDLRAGLGTRSGGQQRRVFERELPVGETKSPEQQSAVQPFHGNPVGAHDRLPSVGALRDWSDHASVQVGARMDSGTGHDFGPEFSKPNQIRRVYDILNCGPLSRFVVLGTQGPFIVHNCDQATCRDIQRHGLIKLHRAGYPTVLHVYDENVGEVPEGSGFVEEYEMIMAELPAWCQGWPIRAAGGWRGQRYRKD